MKVTTEKLEGSRVSLEVECSQEVVDEALTNAFKRIVRKVTIPGFRRGKAPRTLVERFYGAELYEEAIQEALPRQYIKAVQEAKIEPVDDPEFSEVHFVKGEPLRFKATVYVIPEVKLGEYDSISVAFESAQVSEEDIEEQIELLKERMAELRPMEAEQTLAAGHYATCHVKSVDSREDSVEEPVEDSQEEPDEASESEGSKPGFEFDEELSYVEVGREYTMVPGLGEALVGMKKGEAKQFEGTYSSEEGKDSKTYRFHVEVKEVYEKYVPEDIEEIANNVGKASGEELREDIKEHLMELRVRMAREQHSGKVQEELLQNADVEIPKVMVSTRAQTLLERFQNRLAEAGLKMEDYLASTEQSWEDIESELEKQAEEDVKCDLVLDTLAEEKNVEVSEDTVDKVIEGLAVEMDQDPGAVKTTLELRGALDSIRLQLRRMETLKIMAEKAALNAGTPLPTEDKQESGSEAHQNQETESKDEESQGLDSENGDGSGEAAGQETQEHDEPSEEAVKEDNK